MYEFLNNTATEGSVQQRCKECRQYTEQMNYLLTENKYDGKISIFVGTASARRPFGCDLNKKSILDKKNILNMSNSARHMLFNPSNSINNKSFKFHHIDNITVFISLKAIEESIGYSKKLFPGDDRDRIIVKKQTEKYFKILDKTLEEKLKPFINTKKTIVFVYEEINEINTLKLIDFYFYEEDKIEKTVVLEEFPRRIIPDDTWNNFEKDIDINWDELW